VTLPTALERILKYKREELIGAKDAHPMSLLQELIANEGPPRDGLAALAGPCPEGRRSRIIAEVKEASPSKGILRKDMNATTLAQSYEQNGAAVVSVLTDAHFFHGSFERLVEVRQAIDLPILCKEFILDPWQLYRARSVGADLILLIVSALERAELSSLLEESRALGMEALVEVHDGEEAQIALDVGARIIGVNNRNLHTFETHLQTSHDLASQFPDDIVTVSESGIQTRNDIEELEGSGYQAFLIGERFVIDADPGAAVAALAG